MTSRVSVPEKTLEHWSSQYVMLRYRSLSSMWWPASGEDIDVRQLPSAPGKAVQLEVKTTTPAGTGLHDVNVDLGQLWKYSRKKLGQQPFYVFPWPHWDGNLPAAARAQQPPEEVTEFAFRRSGSPWWFAEWMVVLTTRQVEGVLARELNAHASPAPRKKRLVRIDIKNAGNTVWGDPASPAAPPDVTPWLDFWDEIDGCGRDGWPQLIRLPRLLVARRIQDPAQGVRRAGYAREEILAFLRQSTDFPLREDDEFPLVTLTPSAEGEYRITDDPSAEQDQPGADDDDAELPDDNRAIIFMDSRTLLRARP